jgi:hypothetical protein
MINPPQRVMLRNKEHAVITKRAQNCAPFVFTGLTLADQCSQLWREDGCWREDGARHHLDIVGLIDAQGKVSVYAAAAGAKEAA